MLWILNSVPKTRFTMQSLDSRGVKKRRDSKNSHKSHCCPSHKLKERALTCAQSRETEAKTCPKAWKVLFFPFFSWYHLHKNTTLLILKLVFFIIRSLICNLTPYSLLLIDHKIRVDRMGQDRMNCLEVETERDSVVDTNSTKAEKTFCAPNHERFDLNPLGHKSCPSFSLLVPLLPFPFIRSLLHAVKWEKKEGWSQWEEFSRHHA